MYFDNFAIQATVLFGQRAVQNITAPSATLANVAATSRCSSSSCLGKEKDFTISADATDFEMDAIQINGIPTLDIDDPDTTEIKDKIYELKGWGERTGRWRLPARRRSHPAAGWRPRAEDGAADLYDGNDDLYDGVKGPG